jgi:hypothetical protein
MARDSPQHDVLCVHSAVQSARTRLSACSGSGCQPEPECEWWRGGALACEQVAEAIPALETAVEPSPRGPWKGGYSAIGAPPMMGPITHRGTGCEAGSPDLRPGDAHIRAFVLGPSAAQDAACQCAQGRIQVGLPRRRKWRARAGAITPKLTSS